MPNNLTESDIRRLCGDSTYQRGLEYYRRGWVKAITVEEAGGGQPPLSAEDLNVLFEPL